MVLVKVAKVAKSPKDAKRDRHGGAKAEGAEMKKKGARQKK